MLEITTGATQDQPLSIENAPFKIIDLNFNSAISGNLLEHILRFGRLLRLMGVKVNLSQTLELVRALDVIPITNKRDFYFGARALLITRHEDYLFFDRCKLDEWV